MDDVSYLATFRTTDGVLVQQGLSMETIRTVPFPGMGIVGSDARRWIIVNVWYNAEKHAPLDRGNTVIVRPAEEDEDYPRYVDPNYYTAENRTDS